MSKKRLRHPSRLGGPAPGPSKDDPLYWAGRLFKSRYTYKGTVFEVRKWSVKIQHRGQRKTFSLRSSLRSQAAAEACELYQALVRHGWSERVAPSAPALTRRGKTGFPTADRLQASYWEQRLIHREYSMSFRPEPRLALSIRIDHGGSGHYFPLGTDSRRVAARRALQVYRSIVWYGWEKANRRFSRELTVAFRWLDSPLAWTYTTLHTLPAAMARELMRAASMPNSGVPVAVVESDAEIRRALEWSLNHMEGFRCGATYAGGREAVQGLARQPVQLALISHSLYDEPGTNCLAELKVSAPATPALFYSVYEDSEELFRATPGGAGTYLLRRTAPTDFLQPIAGRLRDGPLRPEEMAPAAWHYFTETVASMPLGGTVRHLASLTHRELEVLGLLSKGHPDKDIADRLEISIHTVHEHVRNIFEKLGARNRTEAAVKFLQK